MDFENILEISHWLLFSSGYKMKDISIKNECDYFML